MLGFYRRGFRDLFYQPSGVVFDAVVTSLAGYWRPSLVTRFWQAVFFLLARVQERVPLAVPRLPGVGTGRVDKPSGGGSGQSAPSPSPR